MRIYDCINFQLSNAQNSVLSYFRKILLPFGVTPSQYSVLSCLWEQDLQPPSQLAQKLNLDPSTMTGLITRMEGKKLIKRQFSQENLRTTVIHITEYGSSLEEGIIKAIEDANNLILDGISGKEHDVLLKCFEIMQRNAQK